MFQKRPYPSATRWGNCCSWNSGVRLPVDTSYFSSWNNGSGGSPKWNLIFKPLDHEFFAKWYQDRKDLPLSCESQLIGQNLDCLSCAFKGLSSKTILDHGQFASIGSTRWYMQYFCCDHGTIPLQRWGTSSSSSARAHLTCSPTSGPGDCSCLSTVCMAIQFYSMTFKAPRPLCLLVAKWFVATSHDFQGFQDGRPFLKERQSRGAICRGAFLQNLLRIHPADMETLWYAFITDPLFIFFHERITKYLYR